MKAYSGAVIDDNSFTVDGVRVDVYQANKLASEGNRVKLYRDASRTRPISNPFTTDAKGQYRFFAEEEDAVLLLTKNGYKALEQILASELVNVIDFHAVGSGDEHEELQAALDHAAKLVSATVLFPSTSYNSSVGLVLAPASGQIHVNLLGLGGAGVGGVTLNYTGAGGDALTIKNNTRYQVQNLRIIDGGTGVRGLFLTSLTVGSNHGPATYTNVFVSGFTNDVQLGDTDNKAASEILFINLETAAATRGVLIQGPASGTSFTTSIRFIGHQAVSCGDAIVVAGDKTGTQIKLSIWGFSYSFNSREWDFQVPGVYDIASGYTESDTDGQLFRSGASDPTQNSAYVTNLTIKSVTTNYPSSPSNFVALAYQPGHYLIEQSTLQTGSIQLGGFDGGAGPRKATLEIKGSSIVSGSPVIAYKAGSNTVWHVDIRRNGTANTEVVNALDDKVSLFRTDGTEHILSFFPWSASAGTLNLAGIYVAADTTPTAIGLNANNVLTITNAGPVSITTFDDGYEGQVINLLFTDGFTTLVDGATLQLAGGVNFVSSANDTMTLQKIGSVWYERTRSVN